MNPSCGLSSSEAVARLCPLCGLCCNGVIFANVKLQPNEDPARLAALGVRLQRRGRRHRFAQPCAAFDGRLCRVYPHRPARCRDFECGLLRRVRSGAFTPETAFGYIRQALQAVHHVRALLNQLGCSREDWPLTQRYRQAMLQPLDLARQDRAADGAGDLLLAMRDLMDQLQRQFLR